jgi:alanyl-tRNA synthetase
VSDITSAEIRQSFIDFFKERDHSHQPSSPVIPFDDPTLLFINAGMNQFKDVFTGSRKVSYKRAVSSQKCIRAGGKHNDLENVGETGRHHTFFEMLGNFSFGDYFKEEAIVYAWDWVTKVLGLSKDKLYATVYDDDDEAFELWEKIAPELKNGRVLRFGKKDNYWSMGDVGPCGPCSEIHYDQGEHLSKNDPDAWVNTENERFVEIWNLVFMQYDQPPGGGELVSLPKPSVDTGAGLERIAAAMQGVDSNYESDLFAPLTSHVADITGVKYDTGTIGTSHRVIADHVRALSFALADGGGLSNEGRGYVLRRILRRGARHGRLLGYKEPLIFKLVPTLIDIMGSYFTELREKQKHIENVIKSEEERFGELLDTGLELFASLKKKVKASGSDTIPGEDIFKLYDTYGFPVDMTAIMAREADLKMDMGGFEKHMSARQEQSRAGSNFEDDAGRYLKTFLEQSAARELWEEQPCFVRGEGSPVFEVNTEILAVGQIETPDKVAVVLQDTPFYTESGGQVADRGIISWDSTVMIVEKVIKYDDIPIHVGHLDKGTLGQLTPGEKAVARIDIPRRWDIMRNHTATHLLHAALRQVVGDHVKQSGSMVDDERLRFDFAHFKALTPEEIAEIEKIVNEKILEGLPVTTEEMPADKAIKSGAMALFDEKYGDDVRVVYIGEGDDLLTGEDIYSKELCGGTHVTNTAQIGSCIVTDESAIASGVRRIEAVTGRGAAELARANKQRVDQVGAMLNVPTEDVIDAVKKMTTTVSDLQKENKKLKSERFSGGAGSIGKKEKVGKIEFAHNDFGKIDQESASGWVDSFKGMSHSAVAVAVGVINDKRTFIAGASKSAVDSGFDCGKVFGELVREMGGRGGGKAAFARGSIPDNLSYDDFVVGVREKIAKTQA